MYVLPAFEMVEEKKAVERSPIAPEDREHNRGSSSSLCTQPHTALHTEGHQNIRLIGLHYITLHYSDNCLPPFQLALSLSLSLSCFTGRQVTTAHN